MEQLNPRGPNLTAPFISGVAAFQANGALSYPPSRPKAIGGQGLLYPFRSSFFRSMFGTSQAFLKYAPAVNVAVAEAAALWTGGKAWEAGHCR